MYGQLQMFQVKLQMIAVTTKWSCAGSENNVSKS